jgi:hypothetical protein
LEVTLDDPTEGQGTIVEEETTLEGIRRILCAVAGEMDIRKVIHIAKPTLDG